MGGWTDAQLTLHALRNAARRARLRNIPGDNDVNLHFHHPFPPRHQRLLYEYAPRVTGTRVQLPAQTSITASRCHQPDNDDDPSQQAFQCRDGRSLPRHTVQSVDLPDGLYLGLFNGRDDPLGSPLVTGFDGPLIGRLRYCHTVEARDLKLESLDPFEGYRFFPDMEHVAGRDGQTPTGRITMPIQLMLNAGAIVFDGRYFADWTVFIISSVRTVIGRDLRSQRRL